jgi:hypothetical protein
MAKRTLEPSLTVGLPPRNAGRMPKRRVATLSHSGKMEFFEDLLTNLLTAIKTQEFLKGVSG